MVPNETYTKTICAPGAGTMRNCCTDEKRSMTHDECGRHVERHDGGDFHVLRGILDDRGGGHGS